MSRITELEAEAEVTRNRLNATIDRIQEKLTLTGMVDEVMGQAGVPKMANGHDLMLTLLRKHPVPVMIAAAGLGFMIYQMNRRGRRPGSVAIPPVVDVPALNDGQSRGYDPDLPVRHPPHDDLTGTRRVGA